MSQLEVVLQIPRYIEMGLATGQFERVGGVVVESGSKQVVAWLRDGSILEQTGKMFSNVSPLNVVSNVANSGVTVVDGMQTRAVMRLLETQIHNLTSFTVAGQLLNLSMTLVSLRVILNRVNQLSELVSELGETVRSEFERNRDVDFKGALEQARDALESSDVVNRTQSARNAIADLYKSRQQFVINFNQIVSSSYAYETLLLAQQYLIRAMFAESSRAYCYLETHEYDLAKTRLTESINALKADVKTLVERWMGDRPAIFVHKDVSKEDLGRFFRIQLWLANDEETETKSLIDVLDDLRGDFWNGEMLKAEYASIMKRVTRKPNSRHEDRVFELSDRLTQAEIVIENFNRLRGFELEMRSLRLSHSDWKSQVSHLMRHDGITESNPIVLIHDMEMQEVFERM
ncbi:MAG: hypothetical protein RLP44_03630 [Aggregatilineales bacterium]